MSLLTTIGLGTLTFLNVNVLNPPKEFFPEKQEIINENQITYSDYYYSEKGELTESEPNNLSQNRFYVKLNNKFSVPIDITGTSKSLMCTEIGYLARILAAESLTYVQNGHAKNISMFTRTCIAESIRNRKESALGFYAKYNKYRDVIYYTGYATNAKEFKYTKNWLKNPIAKKRFVEEVLPVAIFTYFNNTDFTDDATGFITPAKMSVSVYNAFKKRTLIEIIGIDPYNEFTFWKY